MKRRVRKIANFFAFNLLFFALYLNFIHKDKVVSTTAIQSTQQNTAAFSGTVLVTPEKKNESASAVTPVQTVSEKATEENSTALKLSIN
jgi:hypothetical protein